MKEPQPTLTIPANPRTGKPLITTEMKIECIGEFYWDEDAPYYDENGKLHDHIQRNAVPWTLCKEIYKKMAMCAANGMKHKD